MNAEVCRGCRIVSENVSLCCHAQDVTLYVTVERSLLLSNRAISLTYYPYTTNPSSR